MSQRPNVTCHLCFEDRKLREWVKGQSKVRRKCPWCGRHGWQIDQSELSAMFREVADTFKPLDGPYLYESGEQIGELIDNHWQVFSEEIQTQDLVQELTTSILYADMSGKDRFELPDYDGLFVSPNYDLEEIWDEWANRALSGELPELRKGEFAPPQSSTVAIEELLGIPIEAVSGESDSGGSELEGEKDARAELPVRLALAFEDLAVAMPEGQSYFRARRYDDRHQATWFEDHELGAPPADRATAGRGNEKGHPVLYLPDDKSTAIAEVRAWKGVAVGIAQMRLKREMLLVDLTQIVEIESPFFVPDLKWRAELVGLLSRLADDMSRPLMPNDSDILYRPTQLLARMIQVCEYDGCVYPSAMGSGKNVLLFDTDAVDIVASEHVRVSEVAFESEPMPLGGPIYHSGPYDHAQDKGKSGP